MEQIFEAQMAALAPHDAASLAAWTAVVGGWLETVVGRGPPAEAEQAALLPLIAAAAAAAKPGAPSEFTLPVLSQTGPSGTHGPSPSSCCPPQLPPAALTFAATAAALRCTLRPVWCSLFLQKALQLLAGTVHCTLAVPAGWQLAGGRVVVSCGGEDSATGAIVAAGSASLTVGLLGACQEPLLATAPVRSHALAPLSYLLSPCSSVLSPLPLLCTLLSPASPLTSLSALHLHQHP